MRAWWALLVVGAMVGCGKESSEGDNAADCADQADNDADGFSDCDDNGCWTAPACVGQGGSGEGTEAGDCTDRADNDADGFFDCDDSGCAGSPDCQTEDTDVVDTNPGGGGGDTDVPADTDIPDPTGTGVIDKYKSFSLTYQMSTSWDQFGTTVCETYFEAGTGNCNCTAVYHGSGHLVEADGTRNTYDGEFVLVSSDCIHSPVVAGSPMSDLSLNDGSVYRPEDGKTFHTFRVNSTATKLSQWISHVDETMIQPSTTPFEDQQWWIKLTVNSRNALDPVTGAVDYEEQEAIPVGVVYYMVTSKLKVQFSESTTIPDYPTIP